jgi:hypothetical protein
MNRAQQQLVWSGAIFMALLAGAAAKEIGRQGLNCKEDLVGWVDGRGRWVEAKTQRCE